jgi:hypothetical protein
MEILVGLVGVTLWLRISQKPYVMQVPERYIAGSGKIDELPDLETSQITVMR